MRIITLKYILLLVLITYSVIGDEQRPKWLDERASFRAFFKTDKDESSLLFSDWLFPNNFNHGLRAFDEAGNSVELKLDISGRALIFPANAEAKTISIYGGYSEEAQVELPKKSSEHDILSLDTTTMYGQAGSVKQYIDNAKSASKRTVNREYQNMLGMHNDTLQSLLAPGSIGLFVPAGWWEINWMIPSQKLPPYAASQNQCRHLYSHIKTRLFKTPALKYFATDNDLYGNRIWYKSYSYLSKREHQKKAWVKKISEDIEKNIFTALKDSFTSKNKRPKTRTYPNNIKLVSREHDLSGRILLNYQGTLAIAEDAEYEFEVNTNSMWLLEIDGKEVAKRELNTNIEENHKHIVKVELKAGLYPFNFLYSRCDSPLDLELRYRYSEHNWQTLGGNMFAPAPKIAPISLDSLEQGEFPIIKRNPLGVFMIGKEEYLELNILNLSNNISWQLEGKKLPKTTMVALAVDKNREDTDLIYKESSFKLPIINSLNKPRQMSGSFSFNLQLPSTIYDDESISGGVEIRNDFPYDLELFMTKSYSNGSSEVSSITAPTGFSFIPLNILDKSGSMDIELWLPGFSFGKHGLHIVPSAEFSHEIGVSHDTLFDKASGRKVCTVLHRMSIGELRKWQLPNILLNGNLNGECLIIGAGESIIDNLKSHWPKRSFELLPWPKASVNGESRLLRGLGSIAKLLQTSTFISVVIVPNLDDIPLLSEREYFRYFAILADLIRAKNSVDKVYIYLNSQNHEDYFRSFAREYGFEILSLKSPNQPF